MASTALVRTGVRRMPPKQPKFGGKRIQYNGPHLNKWDALGAASHTYTSRSTNHNSWKRSAAAGSTYAGGMLATKHVIAHQHSLGGAVGTMIGGAIASNMAASYVGRPVSHKKTPRPHVTTAPHAKHFASAAHGHTKGGMR